MSKYNYSRYFGEPNSKFEDKECLILDCTKLTWTKSSTCDTFATESQNGITRAMLSHLLLNGLIPGPSHSLPKFSELTHSEQLHILTGVSRIDNLSSLGNSLLDSRFDAFLFYSALLKSSSLNSSEIRKILLADKSHLFPHPAIYFSFLINESKTTDAYLKLVEEKLSNEDCAYIVKELLMVDANILTSNLHIPLQQLLAKRNLTLDAEFFMRHLKKMSESNLDVNQKQEGSSKLIENFSRFLSPDEKSKLKQHIELKAQTGELKHLRQKTAWFFNKSAAPIFADDEETYVKVLEALS